MEVCNIEISVMGKPVTVPSIQVGQRTIIATGGWLKTASVRDEAWLEGEAISDPCTALARIHAAGLKADIFTFIQQLPDVNPKHDYPYEWENVASISTSDFDSWWEHKLPQETRKNVRRSVKRGVSVREVEFNDALVKSIVDINNETPIRQGRPFWHYGKSFDVVKRDYATLLDRSVFIGAFHESNLIGFIKMVYMGEIGGILQIVCMNRHQDKRPTNALITKAVEICSNKGLKYLVYGKYIYGNNAYSPLTEFKRRNGFEHTLIPRYFIPLTIKGRLAIALGLHLSYKRFIPGYLYLLMGKIRSLWYQNKFQKSGVSEEKDRHVLEGQ